MNLRFGVTAHLEKQHLAWAAVAATVGLAGFDLRAHAETPWIRHTIQAGGTSFNGADGARLGDVNADGFVDVVTGAEQSGVTRVMLNPGPGRAVTQPWQSFTLVGTNDVEDAFLADVDGDGRLDIVTSMEGSTQDVKVHFAPTTGDITNAASWNTYKLAAADNVNKWMFGTATQLDGHNGIDLIVAAKVDGGPPAQLGWLEAPPNPRSASGWSLHRIADVGWAMSVIDYDLDGDGDHDVIVSDRTNSTSSSQGLRWFGNPSESGLAALKNPWTEHRIGPNRSLMFMDLADVSGDGKLDMVTITNGGDLYWFEQQNIATNTWTEHRVRWPSDGVSRVGKSVRVADVNGDGKLDFLVAFEGTQGAADVLWLESPTDVFATNWNVHDVSGAPGDKYDLMQLLDLDGDGDLDVITTEEGRTGGDAGLGVIWYENPTKTPEPGSMLLVTGLGAMKRRRRQTVLV